MSITVFLEFFLKKLDIQLNVLKLKEVRQCYTGRRDPDPVSIHLLLFHMHVNSANAPCMCFSFFVFFIQETANQTNSAVVHSIYTPNCVISALWREIQTFLFKFVAARIIYPFSSIMPHATRSFIYSFNGCCGLRRPMIHFINKEN
jgi:hypothetical protein